MSEPVYAPHAEKEFGRLSYTVQRHVPRKMARVVLMGAQLRGLPSTTNKKTKG